MASEMTWQEKVAEAIYAAETGASWTDGASESTKEHYRFAAAAALAQVPDGWAKAEGQWVNIDPEGWAETLVSPLRAIRDEDYDALGLTSQQRESVRLGQGEADYLVIDAMKLAARRALEQAGG